MTLDISVIIPVHNRASVIVRAIRSVLSQSLPAKEIIVVDDGSTDQTSTVVEREFPEVRLIQQKNLGVSAARNTGIHHASGDWIALLDSDDEWKPEKLQRQVSALHENPIFQVCHTDEVWIRNGKRVNPMKKHRKPDGWIFERCVALCCVSPSAVLIHNSVLEKVGLFDQNLPVCEDYDMWLRVFSRYPILLVNAHLLVKYGGHADQLSRKYWGMDRFRVVALIKILEQGRLNQLQYQAAKRILLEKLSILIQGFSKRSNQLELEKYQRIYDTYTRNMRLERAGKHC